MFAALGRSIRVKVMALMIATTFAALLFTAITLVLYDLVTYQKAWVNDLTTQASLVGKASAPALAFDDPITAQKNLELLGDRPQILAAAIYTRQDSLFATYVREGEGTAPPLLRPRAQGYRIDRARGVLLQHIADPTGRVGAIYLEARYELAQRLRSYLAIIAAVMAASLLVAGATSYRLQAAVTKPLLAITDVSHKVKARRDYSLRVTKTTDDEIGDLVDTFNEMLSEVGQRTAAIEETNRSLEREMTVRHEAERALRAADQRKDEFLATLAHELRNPLAPLRNALEILSRSESDPVASRRAREIMDRQLKHMVRLVDDLLDVSRITTGKFTLQKQRVQLSAIVDGALDVVRPTLEGRRIQFSVSIPQEPVYLEADPTRLSQALLNLLHNAAKFTEPGGSVSLDADVAPGTVTIAVTDDGMGIPPELLPQVFHMFAQLDHSLDRAHAGLGVGLSLAKRFVELHGGTLEAESGGVGKGCRFLIRLPTADAPPPARSSELTRDGTAPHVKRRVLLADDNADFVESFTVLLRSMGHEVHFARDGREALRTATALEPDVAFLDIGLPKLDGYELARRIRELPWSRDTLLVAVTGFGQREDRRRAEEAGFDHHVVKPIESGQLRDILSRLDENGARYGTEKGRAQS
jgi:signal transduction histidine kinase/ActR/RegA family two-component response regulator